MKFYFVVVFVLLIVSLFHSRKTSWSILIILPIIILEFAASYFIADLVDRALRDGAGLILFPITLLLVFVCFILINVFLFPSKNKDDW